MRAKPASQYTDTERRELLARQKASGMSIRAFASTVGLSAATISHWRWRLSRSEPSASKPQSSPAFVQLTVDPPSSISRPTSSVHFELLLTSGLLVRVPTAFDKDALARLLAVLGVSSC